MFWLIIKNKMKLRKIGLKENSKKCFEPRKQFYKTYSKFRSKNGFSS